MVQQWLCEERLVEQLVDKFVKADEDPDMQECIAQTFQDLVLVSTSMFSALQMTPEIVTRLESEYVVNTLFVHILQSVCDFRSISFCWECFVVLHCFLFASVNYNVHASLLSSCGAFPMGGNNNPVLSILGHIQFPVNLRSPNGHILHFLVATSTR